MLSFSGSLKVFVAVEPCDMRRSFDGLYNAVTTLLGEDPKSGAFFAFTNKRRSRSRSSTGMEVEIFLFAADAAK